MKVLMWSAFASAALLVAATAVGSAAVLIYTWLL